MSTSTQLISTALIGFLFVSLMVSTSFVYSQGTFAALAETVTSQAVSSNGASIVIDESTQLSISQELVDRAQSSWPWYVTRASGIVAALALLLLMLSGIGFITGSTYSFIEPLTAWATHRSLGIVLTISLAAHMIALYFDHFAPFSVADILVPFASSYKPIELFGLPVGSLYVALGVLSFYMVILIVIVSLLWVERKTSTWKTIHLMSYLVMAFVFFHVLFLGTDFAGGILRFVWIGLGLIVLYATLTRLWRARTL